jgi:hypothetical protein
MKFRFVIPSALALLAAAPLHAQTASDQDFAARCNAAGVLTCVGFDNTTSDIVRGQNLHPDGAGTYRAGLDTATKASGGGSLRFTLPPPPHSGANIAGRWSPTGNGAFGRLFGQNSTFYVQFRQRFSPEMLNNTWDSAWKTVIFHANQTTCGSLELTTHNYYSTNLITMYTDCGSRHMYTNIDGSRHSENTPLLLQQGDHKCEYGKTSAPTCLYFAPNEWLTFYYKITIGTWDQPNSMVEAWIAREGQPGYKQFIRVPSMALSCNQNSCSTSPGRDEGYNNLTFTPYMTALSSNSGRAGVTSNMWVDELIVSTQPIAAPNSGPRPNPPTSVRAE